MYIFICIQVYMFKHMQSLARGSGQVIDCFGRLPASASGLADLNPKTLNPEP